MMLTNFHIFLSSFIFVAGIINFTSNWSHILSTLIALEFISLSLFLILMLMNISYPVENYTGLFFLSLVVCEGALALSILVLFARAQGSDQLKSTTLLQW